MKNINIHIQEAQQIPSTVNSKRSTPRFDYNIVINPLKGKEEL